MICAPVMVLTAVSAKAVAAINPQQQPARAVNPSRTFGGLSGIEIRVVGVAEVVKRFAAFAVESETLDKFRDLEIRVRQIGCQMIPAG